MTLLASFAVLLGLVFSAPSQAKPPLWDKVIPGKGRFKVLKAFGDEAALDKETGLVWQRSPALNAGTWYLNADGCVVTDVAGRFGFRLPRVEELLSLVEGSGTVGSLKLPDGHPFLGAEGGVFWSSSMSSISTAAGLDQLLVLDLDVRTIAALPRNGSARAWCVRGGAGDEVAPLP